jgi:hypothetical protein
MPRTAVIVCLASSRHWPGAMKLRSSSPKRPVGRKLPRINVLRVTLSPHDIFQNKIHPLSRSGLRGGKLQRGSLGDA